MKANSPHLLHAATMGSLLRWSAPLLVLAMVVASGTLLPGQDPEEAAPAAESQAPFNALLATADQRRQHISKLTAVEKERLRRQSERFGELDDEEQQRLRALKQELAAAADRDELLSVMQGYHQWLSLSASERAEFLDLSPEKRIAYIQEIKDTERRRASDREAIAAWIESRLVRHLPDDVQRRLEQLDPRRRRARLADELMPQRKQNRRPPWLQVDEEDFAVLEETLSDEARSRLEGKSLQHKRMLLAYWIKEFADKYVGKIGYSEMHRFFRELPAEQREEIRREFRELPPEEVRERLMVRYLEMNPYDDRAFLEGRSFHRPPSPRFDRDGPRDYPPPPRDRPRGE